MMLAEKNVHDTLKRVYDNKDMEWSSNIAYRIKKSLEDTCKLLRGWLTEDDKAKPIRDVIYDYFDRAFDTQNELGVNFGYTYFNDQVQKFLTNPNSLWEIYDELKDKANLYDEPFIRYTPNEKQNREMFLKEAFSILVTELECPGVLVDYFDEQTRTKIAVLLANYYNKKGRGYFERDCRERLLSKIKEAVSKLAELGVIEANRVNHNNKMKRLGLESLSIGSDIPAVDGDKIFGRDLTKCSILQLEAMLSFYYNQLEKVRENIGFSLFVMQELEGESGFDEESIRIVSDNELKEIWKKYNVLSKISEDVFNTIHKMEIEAEWKIEGDELADIYVSLYEKYVVPYIKLIYGIDVDDEEEAVDELEDNEHEHEESVFERDVQTFALVNESFRMNNYLIKSRLMEDIILQASRQNLNWGIMEEDGEIRIKNVTLVGVDIPGLNMPLRLHYKTYNIQDLMINYLNTRDVPLYVGSDDFDTKGKSEGTPLLVPLTKNESNYIKSVARKNGGISPFTLKFVKHISCAQMPNMVKRLLKERTGGMQSAPATVDISIKKVRPNGDGAFRPFT